MGLFDFFFNKSSGSKSLSEQSNKVAEQAVIVNFNYGKEGMEELYLLSDKLEKEISKNGVGEFDGHEIATDYSDGSLYMYGPNAELLFKTIKPTLESVDFMKGAKATLRFGPVGSGAN